MPKVSKKLSVEELRLIVDEYRAGDSMKILGKRYGVSIPVVRETLYGEGVSITSSNLRMEREESVKMYRSGASPNYIKFKLGISKEMSARFIRDETPNRPRNSSKVMWVDYENLCCFDCYKISPKEEHMVRGKYASRCPKCHFMFVKINIKPVELKMRAQKNGIYYDDSITSEHLTSLMKEQDYKCFYTDLPFVFSNDYSRLSPSIDKMDPGGGYVRDNIVWCTARANVIKNDLTLQELYDYNMPEWAERIKAESRKREVQSCA